MFRGGLKSLKVSLASPFRKKVGVEVIPYVFIPVGGVGSGEELQALPDFDAWLLGANLGPGIDL